MLSGRKTLIYIIFTAAAAGLLFFLYIYRQKIGRIVSPFFMAVVIAYLVYPIVAKLEQRKVPRSVAILLVYLGFSLLAVTSMVFFIPELVNNTKELMNTLPEMTAKYQDIFKAVISAIQSSSWPEDIKNVIFKEINSGMGAAENYITGFLKKSLVELVEAVTTVFNLLLSMVIAYYFIKDAEFFRSKALSLTPRKWRNSTVKVGRGINGILSNFIQGQLLTSLIVGIMETVGLIIVKVKYPLVLGLVGGISNIIPYFGPIIGAVPAVAVALIESPIKAIWTALVFVIIQQIENAFISPKVIEGRLGLHPVTTILAVLIGGEFFGILGMLVSVPVAAILKVILKSIIEAFV
jgi:predicted PurR-regulated permease PerM